MQVDMRLQPEHDVTNTEGAEGGGQGVEKQGRVTRRQPIK